MTTPVDPGAIDLEAEKVELELQQDDLPCDTLDRIAALIAAVEALRKRVAELESNRQFPVAMHFRNRAEAAEARVEKLEGALLWMADADPQLVDAARARFLGGE